MSEAKYGKTMMSSIVPVFRFAHTGYLADYRWKPRLFLFSSSR
ncbi:hypothetical protein [Coxiella burnetii]|nr:hypothetical protein COXBURSA331_A0557 [Coxiella burnetii RSA 331]